MKTLILLFALALTACGYDPEAANSETQATEDGEVGEDSETARPAKTRDDHSVNVDVEVNVNTGHLSDDWLYVESRKTFREASQAPVGFHLPTRLELLEALTDGSVAEYEGSVWTSEHASDRDDYVFFMRLKDGASFAYPNDSLFGALYKRNE